jgi:hypothetical protein
MVWKMTLETTHVVTTGITIAREIKHGDNKGDRYEKNCHAESGFS